jgi:hypothetical protein
MRSVISRTFALFAAVAFVVGALAAGDLPPQTSSQSGVTVKVTPRSLSGAAWEFDMAFDTHSQDLKDDLLKSAVLVVDGGTPFSPTGWQGDHPGGHHRKGMLRFKAPAASTPGNVELRLSRAGESAPRVFRWQLR